MDDLSNNNTFNSNTTKTDDTTTTSTASTSSDDPAQNNDTPTTMPTGSLPTMQEQPVWKPCRQNSQTSYLNFTFEPYPIV
jgi:hypothetical protein